MFNTIKLFPSPINEKEVNLTFTSNVEEKVIAQVIDNIGNLVF